MSWTIMAKIVIKRESREEKHDDGRLEMKTAPSLAPEGRARRAANLNAQPKATSCESWPRDFRRTMVQIMPRAIL